MLEDLQCKRADLSISACFVRLIAFMLERTKGTRSLAMFWSFKALGFKQVRSRRRLLHFSFFSVADVILPHVGEQVLLTAMVAHPKSAAMQFRCCGALLAMALNNIPAQVRPLCLDQPRKVSRGCAMPICVCEPLLMSVFRILLLVATLRLSDFPHKTYTVLWKSHGSCDVVLLSTLCLMFRPSEAILRVRLSVLWRVSASLAWFPTSLESVSWYAY